jgi:TPR repeat protein
LAGNACAQETAAPGAAPRLTYQLGRALLAKNDFKGARREFDRAASSGYRAAQVDLAGLLLDARAGPTDNSRAVSLYENAWADGVPIAAYELGRLYERGVPSATGTVPLVRQPDLAKSWSWYQRGADIGEPHALARFGERDDASAVPERLQRKRDALLLKAFASYAAAAERAQAQGWPDDTWKHWRYRRATLARLLAHDGLMRQVASTYIAVRAGVQRQKEE